MKERHVWGVSLAKSSISNGPMEVLTRTRPVGSGSILYCDDMAKTPMHTQNSTKLLKTNVDPGGQPPTPQNPVIQGFQRFGPRPKVLYSRLGNVFTAIIQPGIRRDAASRRTTSEP